MKKAQTRENRINYISFIQIISMLFIVLSHSEPEGDNVLRFITVSIPLLQAAALVTFMWTSGFLAVFTKQLEKYGYSGYIKRRLLRLIVPFFAVSLLMLAPKYLIARFQGSAFSLNPIEIALQFFTPRDSILPHLWFLPTLFIFCVLLPLIKKAVQNKIIAFITLGVLIAFQFVVPITKLLCFDDILRYLLWFFLGALFAQLQQDGKYEIKLNFCIPFALVFWAAYMLLPFIIKGAVLTFALRGACLFTMLTIALLLEKYTDGFCKTFGKYTFPIYIFSLPLQNVLSIIFLKLSLPVLLAYILLFVLGVLVPYVIALTVDRFDKTKILCRIMGM